MYVDYDEIVNVWAWKDGINGKPNLKNPYHKLKLLEVLEELNYPLDLLDNPIITEASIFDDKYRVGDRFLLGAAGITSIPKYLPDGESCPTGMFIKHAETSDAIKVFHQKETGVNFWLKAENGKVYHFRGKSTVLDKWFKKAAKNPGDISFNDKTLETCALLGLSIDGIGWLKTFNSAAFTSLEDIDRAKKVTEFKNEVNSTLGSGGDWAPHNLNAISTCPLSQIVQIASIAAGMQKFVESKGLKGWNFIHNGIKNYYNAEIENPFIETVGGKDNTADCVLVKGDTTTFLKNFKTSKVVDYKGGECKLSTDDKFYQVSLKKIDGGAQLGKITADFATKFGLLTSQDLVNLYIHESVDKDGNYVLLDEGFRDFIKKGKELAQNFGKSVMNRIVSLSKSISTFYSAVTSKFKSATNQANKTGDSILLKIAKKHKLDEAKGGGILDTIRSFSEEYNNGNRKGLQEFVAKVNAKLGEVSATCASSTGAYYLPKSVENFTIPKKVDIDTIIKFLANYKALDAFMRVLKDGQKFRDASEIFEEFAELEKEMFFGRTQLPLFKVYGLDASGGGKAFEFLNSGKEFVSDRKSQLEGVDVNNVFLVYVTSKPEKGYATLAAYIFSRMDDTKGAIFNKTNFRTNDTGQITFVIEAGNTEEYSKLKSKHSIP